MIFELTATTPALYIVSWRVFKSEKNNFKCKIHHAIKSAVNFYHAGAVNFYNAEAFKTRVCRVARFFLMQ
jgi:hypothetical protein